MLNKFESEFSMILPGQMITVGLEIGIQEKIKSEFYILQEARNVPILPISLMPISIFNFQNSLQSWKLIRGLEAIAIHKLDIVSLFRQL
jgi:hypothetical protein